MKIIKPLLIALSLVLITGCASNIQTKDFSDNGLQNFKTYAFSSDVNTDNKATVDESLASLINITMIEKGYSYSKNNPDMVISLNTSAEIKEYLKDKKNEGGANSTGPNFSSTSSGSTKRYTSNDQEFDSSRRPLKKGSIAVEIFSRESNKLLWMGVIKEFKSLIGDETFKERMILQIFKDFPSK